VLVPLTSMPGRLEVGAQAGADWMYQVLQSGRSLNALAGHWEALLQLSFPFGPVRVGTQVAAGIERFPVDSGPPNQFFATGAVVAGVEF